MVRCWVAGVPGSPLRRNLRKLVDGRAIQPFDSRLGEFIYQMPLVIQDESLGERGFQVVLFSYDGKGEDFFGRLQLKDIFGHQVVREEAIFEEYCNRLV